MSVILPDHMHFIWTLTPENSDFSTRWRLIKSHFTRNWCAKDAVSENASRVQKGEKDIWQRRFWERLIRDELGNSGKASVEWSEEVGNSRQKPGEQSKFRLYLTDVNPR